MTQIRNTQCSHCGGDLDPISNWFDTQLHGIGHRGSSFTNIDAVTHDKATNRFLFQEFKRPGEECLLGQWMALYALAQHPQNTVWLAGQSEGLQSVGLTVMRKVAPGEILRPKTISLDGYRRRFGAWWNVEADEESIAV